MLGDDTVLVECGPMRMFIDASVNGRRVPQLERQAAIKAIEFLSEVARDRDKLNIPAVLIKEEPSSAVVKEMWKACRVVNSSDLTPMAAVAGSIADATADYLTDLGATKIIVNNGGDIALRILEEAPVTVGIRSDLKSRLAQFKLTIERWDNLGGVCTSGLGGRSLTRGIASAAVVFAKKSSVADAAATEIANHTSIDSPKIKKTHARNLDPDSDIKDLEVTLNFDSLDGNEIEEAISKGLMRAKELVNSRAIVGAFVRVCDKFQAIGDLMTRLEPLNKSM